MPLWVCQLTRDQGDRRMTALPEPHFIDREPEVIRNEIVAAVEAATGETFPPMSTERILCEQLAYRETLVRIAIQQACLQNLWAYARFPMIDHLAALVNEGRLPAEAATAPFVLTLPATRGVVSVAPSGTKVRTTDGKVVFALDEDISIAVGALTGAGTGTATATGPSANGYLAGQVSEIVSPLGFTATLSNTATTDGGAISETTEAMRLRVPRTLAKVSGAGPGDAYEALALNASPNVIDARATSPGDGLVEVTVLASYGEPTSGLLAEVLEALSSDTQIPLTDEEGLTVIGGDAVPVVLVLSVTLYHPRPPRTTQDALDDVETAAVAWVTSRGRRLGYQLPDGPLLKAALAVIEVYQVAVTSSLPVIGAKQFAQLVSCTVNLAGYTEEPLP